MIQPRYVALCYVSGHAQPINSKFHFKVEILKFYFGSANFAISADSESFVFLKNLFIFKACIKNENMNNKFRTSCGFF